MKRDSCTRKQVLQRMNLQMSEEKKKKFYDFFLRNEIEDLNDVSCAIHEIDTKLRKVEN